VRANLTGPEKLTAVEAESALTLDLGEPVAPPPPPDHPPTILAEQQPPTEIERGLPLTADQQPRQVLFDLAGSCNVTTEELMSIKFRYDYQGGPAIPGLTGGKELYPIAGWWGNPLLAMPPSPRVLKAPTGVVFLTAGRPEPGAGTVPKNLLALSSWPPYPLPAGATVEVGLRCERLWLLLQSYVHPMKNYIPNGEVVLHYAGGKRTIESLVPPFNLDCYFQHFARRGTVVPYGQVGVPGPSSPLDQGKPHADALEIACDPAQTLERVEIRATCSEGAIGVVGMTAVQRR